MPGRAPRFGVSLLANQDGGEYFVQGLELKRRSGIWIAGDCDVELQDLFTPNKASTEVSCQDL